MATSTDSLQRPKFQYSQSFRHQATQDALADCPPLARTPIERQGSYGVETINDTLPRPDNDSSANIQALSLNEGILHHRLNATGSVQAIVVDDDVLFVGLQGGDLVVRIGLTDCDA